ncbi:MAG: dermonecrotic toxin domain-containing protein [Candidatus Arsenophonus phytopathogenicus]
MNQENLPKKYNHANEMLEIKNYAEFKNKVLSNIPNLKLMAKGFMQEHIKELTGQDIDPDKVRLYSFKSASPLPKTYSGWEYWDPIKSLTLTELAFKNFSAHDQDLTSDDLKLNYGVYKEDTKENYTGIFRFGKEYFGEKNQVRILPSDLRKILNENDFYALVKNSLNTFWENHEDDMLTLAKADFVSKARRSMLEGLLSDNDYKFVMQTVVPHIPLEGPVTINQLSSKNHSHGCVYTLDINGYISNDILRFIKNDGHEILYIPGERRPFEVFENDKEMRHWIVKQAKDPKKSSRLENHFSLYDRQDGIFHTGVDNGLLHLALRSWDVKEIDKYGNYFFVDDALSTVVKKTKERSFSDADTIIKSNTEVSWEQWLGYTKIANQIFGPIIGLVGGAFGAGLATGAFVAQIGMEVHQAVIGDTEEERKQGFWAATIDIGTTLLFAGFAKFIKVKTELSELSELADVNTEVNIDNLVEKQASGFIKGINKSISVVKVAEDKNGRDIWRKYDPLTEKVLGRCYYRADDGTLEPIPLPLSDRLNKIRTQGLTGGRRLGVADPNLNHSPEELHNEIIPDLDFLRAEAPAEEDRAYEPMTMEELEEFRLEELDDQEAMEVLTEDVEVIDSEMVRLGKRIGSGFFSDVYQDPNEDGFVIKKLKRTGCQPSNSSSEESNNSVSSSSVSSSSVSSSSVSSYSYSYSFDKRLELAKEEASLFGKYYGYDSVKIIKTSKDVYIKMIKINGVKIDKVPKDGFKAGAISKLWEMIVALDKLGIWHNDISRSNILYDSENNIFYPIDLGSYDSSSSRDVIKEYTENSVDKIRTISNYIKENTKSDYSDEENMN